MTDTIATIVGAAGTLATLGVAVWGFVFRLGRREAEWVVRLTSVERGHADHLEAARRRNADLDQRLDQLAVLSSQQLTTVNRLTDAMAHGKEGMAGILADVRRHDARLHEVELQATEHRAAIRALEGKSVLDT